MNRSLLGARNLNQVLQDALNPGNGGPQVERFGWTFRLGDRVIQTENSYDRDVFNVDMGIVEKINRIEQTMTVSFEGRPVEYDFGDLDELALAYVLSIHKSQGSEFPCIVIPVHTQHYLMLQRNLLYTAVTRARSSWSSLVRRKRSAWPCGGWTPGSGTRRYGNVSRTDLRLGETLPMKLGLITDIHEHVEYLRIALGRFHQENVTLTPLPARGKQGDAMTLPDLRFRKWPLWMHGARRW